MKASKKYITISLIFFIFIVGYSMLKSSPKGEILAKIKPLDSLAKEENISKRDSIIKFAFQYLDKPYIYGSCNKDGFDCSGFVYYVFKKFKIEVPRSSSEYQNFGKTIPIDDVKKGDILVFLSPTRNAIGHVGIVTNPAQMKTEFIHASSGKEMRVIISSLKQEGYNRRFVKAINILGE